MLVKFARSQHRERTIVSQIAGTYYYCSHFTARRYASTVYAVVVCPSVRLSHADTLPKRLNVGSHKQRRTIAL